MQRITTKGELVHQLAQANQRVIDMEAREMVATLSRRSKRDRAEAQTLLQRARLFRDDCQAALDAYDPFAGEASETDEARETAAGSGT